MGKIDWDEIGRILSNTADTVSRKTGEVVETTKLKNQIYTLERDMRRNYEALGKMIYDRYANEGTIENEFLEICEDLARQEILIDQYQAEIDERKNDR